jgi:anti-sigma regulatory factor (Ser/Thr protein kinase)
MTEMERGTRSVPLVAGDVAAVPDSVSLLRGTIGAFAAAHGAEAMLMGDIALAVSEAVGNVVVHAYDPGEHGIVHFAADVEDGSLEIVISDEGHGFRSGSSEGLGLGLGVIASMCADFSIRQGDPRGTEVWMRFLLDA